MWACCRRRQLASRSRSPTLQRAGLYAGDQAVRDWLAVFMDQDPELADLARAIRATNPAALFGAHRRLVAAQDSDGSSPLAALRMGWAWVPVGWQTPPSGRVAPPAGQHGGAWDRPLRRAPGRALVGEDLGLDPASPAWDPTINQDVPEPASSRRHPGMFDPSEGPWFPSNREVAGSDASGYSSCGSDGAPSTREMPTVAVSPPLAGEAPAHRAPGSDPDREADSENEAAQRRGAWDEYFPSDSS